MAALGDRPIAELTTHEIGAFLRSLDECGCKPRSVNRHRQLISAAFNYTMREDTYAIARNPAAGTTKRREPPPAVLDFYEPDEVETLARAAEHLASLLPEANRSLATIAETPGARPERHRLSCRSAAGWLPDRRRAALERSLPER